VIGVPFVPRTRLIENRFAGPSNPSARLAVAATHRPIHAPTSDCPRSFRSTPRPCLSFRTRTLLDWPAVAMRLRKDEG
jgi:hypothetical protein